LPHSSYEIHYEFGYFHFLELILGFVYFLLIQNGKNILGAGLLSGIGFTQYNFITLFALLYGLGVLLIIYGPFATWSMSGRIRF
jgi:hypothetical protein